MGGVFSQFFSIFLNDLSLQKTLLLKINLIHGRSIFSIFHMIVKDHTIFH